jgi:dipeptidyl aminopeptidase/acylaminoacyl peptidase
MSIRTSRASVRRLILALVTVALSSAWPGHATAQEVMTPERLWQLERMSVPVVAPAGDMLAFTITRHDIAQNRGRTDLYLVPVEGGQPRRVTEIERVSGPQWRPDGKRIGFLATRDGDTQLWEVAADGADLRQVSRIEGGIANFRYAPNGTHVSFTRRVRVDPTIADRHPDLPNANAQIIDELMYRHWDRWHDGRYSHLFLAEYRDGTLGEPRDLMPDARFDTPLPPFGGVDQIDWSPDGTRIAYTSKAVAGTKAAQSTNSHIFVYELASGGTTNITEWNPGYDVEPVFSPDGRFVAWLSMEREGYEADRNRIFVHDFASGKPRELTVGFDLDAHNLAWAPDGRALFFTAETRGTVHIYEAPLDGSIRQVTEGVHDYGRPRVVRTATGAALVATRMSMSEPADLYRVEPASGEASRLTDINVQQLGPVTMGRVERRLVKATDGAEILTWVIYPPGFDPTRRYPALLYAQGGPQSALSQFFSYRWNFQTLAAQGYIVVAPNRRGVPGFGQAFKEAISQDWGGQAMQDLLSAIDDVAREPYVDRERLGAIGPSFGGFTVFWLAGNHQKRFRTFVAHAGVFNFESMYGATEELFFVNFDIGGPFWEEPRPRSYDFSPHTFAQNWDTPMLVIHGELDFRVPIAEGMQAFTALQVRGIESRFLYFPQEGHWILTPQNGILWHRVVFDWLARHLQPARGTPSAQQP